VSFTRNFQRSLKRAVFHASHVLSIKAKALYITTILISLLLSFGIMYRAYSIILPILFIIVIGLEFIIIAISGTLIDELKEGIAQMYLSAGISRFEYISGWLFASLFYPILTVVSAIIIPAFIISPETLVREITISPYGSSSMPPLLLFSTALIIQIAEHVAIAISIAIYTKRKGLAWFILVLFSLILPFISFLIASLIYFMMMGPRYINPMDQQLIYSLITSIFSPLIALSSFPFNHPQKNIFLSLILLIPLIVTLAIIIVFLLYVKKGLEV